MDEPRNGPREGPPGGPRDGLRDGLRFGLEGKVALVTGASRGIGLAIARRLLREKVKVVICARKPAGLEAARLELENSAGEGGVVGVAGGPSEFPAVPAHIAEEA